jgi:adenylate kinase
MSMKIQNVIVILGPPGSGKGTQGKLLAQQLHYGYLSMGQYLRNFAKGSSPKAAEVREVIDRGEIISDELFEPVFEEVIKSITAAPGIIFDGFPRDSAQIPTLEKFIQHFQVENVRAIFLDVPKDKLLDRIRQRQKN